ncbi:MAG: amino acid ABC transporter permease [Bacillota bacterium]
MDNVMASFSMLSFEGVFSYIMKGVAFTVIIAVFAVFIGLVFGSVLAIARNYCTSKKTKIFKWLATGYIELFRNTPLLLWIFICLVFCPAPSSMPKFWGLSTVEVKLMFKAVVALILFTSSVVAEIVRGGLNAVAKGQFEAGHTQGFSIVQVMIYIVLPQAYKKIVPTLLSQVVTTIKDTSYLANVAVIELMSRIRQIMTGAYMYNGTGTTNVSDVFVLFGLASLIYFIINFSISCVVRHMTKEREKTNIVKPATT